RQTHHRSGLHHGPERATRPGRWHDLHRRSLRSRVGGRQESERQVCDDDHVDDHQHDDKYDHIHDVDHLEHHDDLHQHHDREHHDDLDQHDDVEHHDDLDQHDDVDQHG